MLDELEIERIADAITKKLADKMAELIASVEQEKREIDDAEESDSDEETVVTTMKPSGEVTRSETKRQRRDGPRLQWTPEKKIRVIRAYEREGWQGVRELARIQHESFHAYEMQVWRWQKEEETKKQAAADEVKKAADRKRLEELTGEAGVA